MNACAIIFAAGAASRMKLGGACKSKALLPLPRPAAGCVNDRPTGIEWGSTSSAPWLPALARLVQSYRQAGVQDIFCVTGYHHGEVEALGRKLGMYCVRNAQPEQGMFSSVCVGLAAMPQCDAFFVHPVDIPLVRPSTIGALLEASAGTPDAVLIPEHAGADGHPPLIPGRYRDAILAHDGRGGLAGALAGLACGHVSVPDDPFVLDDMDTPADYDRLCRKASPVLCLVRHGALAPNPERRFIGASDIPLADRGRRQMARLARKLEDFLLDPSLGAIVSSDLQRSRESAQILLRHAQQQGRSDLVLHADAAFDEISLGQWEGLTPQDVRKRFPGQYEARSRNFPSFAPEAGECFAQVQERALVALKQWQQHYPGRCLLLVGHAGVNRCLLAQYLGLPLTAFPTLNDFLRLPQDYAAYCFLPLP